MIQVLIPWIITDLDSLNSSSKTASFIINTKEMVNEKQADKDMLNLLKEKLSPSFSWGAVELHGKREFPNGFKLKITIGIPAERAVDADA